MRIQRLHQDSIIPKKSREGDACYDLYISHDFVLQPHTTWILTTGIAMEIPQGYYGRIYGRSGWSVKGMLVLAGVIDSNYRGEVGIVAHNLGDNPITFGKGDRIAQLAFHKVYDFEFEEVEELSDSNRGVQGYGSSGN